MSIKDWTLYQRTLDYLRLRGRAYRLTFTNAAGNEVLKDLAQFCRADKTCFHADPRLHAVAEGRREVWLRIQNHLRLEPDELYAIYHNPSTIQLKEGD